MTPIWYLARATGMVALVGFTVSVMLGAVASASKDRPSTNQLDRRFLLQMAHRSAAVIGLAMLTAHAALILIDSFVNVSVMGTLIPFTAGFRPLALGAGTLSVYVFAVVALSGALRGRLASSEAAIARWRFVHLSAYAGWALAMAHGIFAGTDTGAWWATAVYVACGLGVLVTVFVRLSAEGRRRARSLTVARTRTATTSGT